jgi:membrane-associated protein
MHIPFLDINLFDIKELITTVGYVGVAFMIFAESGLLIGFFFPGDSLLITTGLLASQGFFNIITLLVVLPLAAIGGDTVGYWFGKKVGPAIFKKEDSLFFRKSHVRKAHAFYEKHGGKTIVLARFVPIVRTFAPIVAGVAKMEYGRFLSFNVFGGLFWSVGMLLIGFFLGNFIPDVDRYLFPLILLIVFLSILPGIIEGYKHNRAKIFEKFLRLVKKVPPEI